MSFKVETVKISTIISLLSLWSCLPRPGQGEASIPLEISFSNEQQAVGVTDVATAKQYALENGYFKGLCGLDPQAGAKIFFSSSYEIGKEAGQSRGVLVEQNGGLYYRQEANPTSQLLLAPGSTFNSGNMSLWEFKQYTHLVNWVVFGEENPGATASSASAAPAVGYQLQDAKIVSFTGSTAGGKASYSNALKLKYTKQNAGGCNSDFLVLLAKDIGLVGLEFAETCMPAGTFKLYVDSQAAAQSASNAAPAADATVEQPSFDTTTPSMQESVQDDVQGLGE